MRHAFRPALAGLAFFLLATIPAFAAPQPMPPALFYALRARFLGPYRGGRVLAVTGVVGHPNLYYFGSVDGGVFRSEDGGVTWTPLFQHGPVASIGAIAVAPSNPKIIYIGTGEADMRSDVSLGGGVFRSTNGGRTWHAVGLTKTRQISAIIISPHNPNHVLVAALGHSFGPNPERGIYMTVDGGRRWHHVLRLNDRTGVADLVADPDNSRVLYATSWSAVRPPWTQYPPLEGYNSAVYRSTDGGRSWRRLKTRGLPLARAGRVGLAVAPHGLLYAVVSAHPGGGIYRSLDGGHTWTLVNADRNLWRRGWYFGEIFVDPKNPDVVYVPNTAFYRPRAEREDPLVAPAHEIEASRVLLGGVNMEGIAVVGGQAIDLRRGLVEPGGPQPSTVDADRDALIDPEDHALRVVGRNPHRVEVVAARGPLDADEVFAAVE